MNCALARTRALLLSGSLSLLAVPSLADESTLVAFFDSKDAVATATWKDSESEFLTQLAAQHELQLEWIDIEERGAPPEVTITPLLVFQNARGRSVYQGRASNRTRIENFVRTSRVIPQAAELWKREDLLVWQCGRAQVAAPLKITALSGEQPEGYSELEFQREAKASIAAALGSFELRNEVVLQRSDRTFYCDFYPYRDAEDRLFLSVALFSQFHCKEAIFTSEEPIFGSYADRGDVFAYATRVLLKALLHEMRASTRGDAFDCVDSSTKVSSWADLGLTLPQASERTGTVDASLELVRNWRVADAAEGAPPRLTFRFPAPLDGTSGQVETLRGSLRLGEDNQLEGATGELTVDVESITLGVEDLDQVVKSVVMLNAKKFPEASFRMQGFSVIEGRLQYGSQVRATVTGTFVMKGKEIEIAVPSIWEPVVNADGESRLLVNGTFTIRLLEPFGIKGPDGPSPQKDTLNFFFAVELEPAA